MNTSFKRSPLPRPPEPAHLRPEEERLLRNTLAAGGRPDCPRCAGPLLVTPVSRNPKVAYVRDRVVVQCTACQLRGAVDTR